eukprot:scaffold64945_cov28-Prasinocladus_malaysianus.AAC.1
MLQSRTFSESLSASRSAAKTTVAGAFLTFTPEQGPSAHQPHNSYMCDWLARDQNRSWALQIGKTWATQQKITLHPRELLLWKRNHYWQTLD